MEDLREIQTTCFPVIHCRTSLQPICLSHHFIHCSKAKLRHQLSNFLGNHVHEVDHVIGTTHEFLSELGILGGDSYRTSIQVTHPHHYTSQHHERCGCKAELLRTQECSDDDVTTGF